MTVSRMTEFNGSGQFHWAIPKTGALVSSSVMRRKAAEKLRTISTDLSGDPMQYGLSD